MLTFVATWSVVISLNSLHNRAAGQEDQDLLNNIQYCGVKEVKKNFPLSPSMKHYIDLTNGELNPNQPGDKVPPAGNYEYRSFPWTAVLLYDASLYVQNKAFDFCSGVLIGENVVLTAGHCFEDEDKAKRTGRVEFDRPTGAKVLLGYRSFDVTKPDVYYRNIRRGALVKLDRNVTFNAYTKPACLPPLSQAPFNRYDSCRGFVLSAYGPSSKEIHLSRSNPPNGSCSVPREDDIVPNREFIAMTSTWWSYGMHKLSYAEKNVLLYDGKGKRKEDKIDHGTWCKLKKRMKTSKPGQEYRLFTDWGWSGSPVLTIRNHHWLVAAVHRGSAKNHKDMKSNLMFGINLAVNEIGLWVKKHYIKCVLHEKCRNLAATVLVNGYPSDVDGIYLDAEEGTPL